MSSYHPKVLVTGFPFNTLDPWNNLNQSLNATTFHKLFLFFNEKKIEKLHIQDVQKPSKWKNLSHWPTHLWSYNSMCGKDAILYCIVRIYNHNKICCHSVKTPQEQKFFVRYLWLRRLLGKYLCPFFHDTLLQWGKLVIITLEMSQCMRQLSERWVWLFWMRRTVLCLTCSR